MKRLLLCAGFFLGISLMSQEKELKKMETVQGNLAVIFPRYIQGEDL